MTDVFWDIDDDSGAIGDSGGESKAIQRQSPSSPMEMALWLILGEFLVGENSSQPYG
ncbi:hypothetical protein F2Q68_00021626 [Brassica cretica]|uniref:Uncharacterized protein n=1 Tax=Brassica cretica TaxID=69181 RepID=A0A8S9FYU4_BRACR|nr:hypothetical protein F2Q68_00021626 [Brassica cretica]